MGKLSRDKGKRGEREVAALLTKHFQRPVLRTFGQSREGHEVPDVDSRPIPLPWWTEVTVGAAPNPFKKWEQAKEACEKANEMRPQVVFVKRDRGPWFVFMKAEDFLAWVPGGEEAK